MQRDNLRRAIISVITRIFGYRDINSLPGRPLSPGLGTLAAFHVLWFDHTSAKWPAAITVSSLFLFRIEPSLVLIARTDILHGGIGKIGN